MARPVDLVVRVTADTGDVVPGMTRLDHQLDEAARSAARLDGELSDISRRDVELDVNSQAIKSARDRIDQLRDDIAQMKTVDIDADTRGAEREIARLKASIRALSEDTGGGGGGAVDLGPRITAGLDEANEGMDDLRGEASSTSAEVAASFDGSIESIAGGFQELAANAFAGFGPAGQLAGLAAAAGIGLVISGLQKSADEANEAKQAVIDLAAEIRDAGGRVEEVDWTTKFQEFGDTVVDTKSWFELWQDSSVTALERAADVAEDTGLSFEDVFKGMAGDVPSATRALDDLNAKIAAQEKVVAKLTPVTDEYQTARIEANAAEYDALRALEGYRDELEEAVGVTQDAIERNELFAKAMGMTVEQYAAQQKAAEDKAAADEASAAAEQALADAYDASLQQSADAVTVYGDLLTTKTEEMRAAAQQHADDTKEATGEAADSWEDYATDVTLTTQDLIDEWNRQAEAAKQFETNLGIIAAAGGQAMADELRAQGPEVAGAVADLIAKSGPEEQKAAIDAHARASGAAGGQAVADGINSKADTVDQAWRSLFSPKPQYGPLASGFVPYPKPPSLLPPALSLGGQSAGVAPSIRVNIAGREVQAIVQQVDGRARESASVYELLGVGGRA
jgi:chromosome segregation ATPase